MKGRITSKRRITSFVAASLLAAAATATAQPDAGAGRRSFQLTPEGDWPRLETPTPDAPTTPAGASVDARDAELTQVTELVKAQRFQDARDGALRWLKRHDTTAPLYDRALYLMAASLRGTRQYIRGFYYCDQLLDEHPESTLYQDALQLQYEIADAYLLGAKDRLAGLRIIGRQDEAVEMLFRIQTRAPGSPVAENALLRTADYYWATEQFDLAADAYRSFAQTYPRSPLVPEVRLREAYANVRQFRSVNFDSTALLNAKALFRRIAAEYPDLARERDVESWLRYSDRQLARKLVENADFYRRTGKPASAAKLCRRTVELYPDLPEAEQARAMLARLEGT